LERVCHTIRKKGPNEKLGWTARIPCRGLKIAEGREQTGIKFWPVTTLIDRARKRLSTGRRETKRKRRESTGKACPKGSGRKTEPASKGGET